MSRHGPIEKVEHDVEAVIAQWAPWMISTAGKILEKQTWLHEDAVQEGTIRFWQRLEEGYPVSVSLFAARQAIVDVARGRRPMGSKATGSQVDTHRHAIPWQRKALSASQGNFEEYEQEPADHSAEAAYEAIDTEDVLDQAFALLSPEQLGAVQAIYLDGMGVGEYAKCLGVHRGTVRFRLDRAIKIMREHLDPVA